MTDEIKTIHASFKKNIAVAATPDDAERIRVQYLGRKGALATIFDALKNLAPEERKRAGEEANALRREIEERLAEKRATLEQTSHEGILKKGWLDVTRPGARLPKGHLHPVTQVLREIEEIFASIGFNIAEGPEIETDFYNFQALNMPPGHPARDMWDTFWLNQPAKDGLIARTDLQNKSVLWPHRDNKFLLRTHTSPVQVRYMETHEPPIRIIAPGIVYRYEATDASHEIQFHQVEGLMVDKNISVANFKAVMREFSSRLFGKKVSLRLRPSYFPFTEPSFEADISCVVCDQKGCSLCKQSGWLELFGAGMVHPAVFKAAGWNPAGIQGFAFGIGFARLVAMKYKIPDVRLLNGGDLRFLHQF